MKKMLFSFLGSLFYSIFISGSDHPVSLSINQSSSVLQRLQDDKSSISLPFKEWSEMFRIFIEYKEAVSSCKEGKSVDFKGIFEKMDDLAGRLPVENNVKDSYLDIIQYRKNEIEILKLRAIVSPISLYAK